MLAKRIIPCLDIKNGRTVKGVNFLDLRDAGDPVELAVKYTQEGADELVFLDITATAEKRKTLIELVSLVAAAINIPFTVGGGIGSVEDVDALLKAGADKVCVNSAALKRPELINELAARFGNQCIVLAVDAKQVEERWVVYQVGGAVNTGLDLFEWVEEGVKRGAGEVLFTSMDHDGTKAGFALEALKKLEKKVNVPIIASGGAGHPDHFVTLFKESDIDAALAASIFHFKEVEIPQLKQLLKTNNIPVR